MLAAGYGWKIQQVNIMASQKLSFGARPEFAPLTLIRMFGKHKVGVLLIWLLLSAVALRYCDATAHDLQIRSPDSRGFSENPRSLCKPVGPRGPARSASPPSISKSKQWELEQAD
jgi:hypothetical protein